MNWKKLIPTFSRLFLQNRKKPDTEKTAFFVINFEPSEVQTHSAPQNDRVNLSFVKDKHIAGKKMARYGLKMTINQLLFFGSLPNLHGVSGCIWGHNFISNQDLDPFRTSKWPSEPQFCER